MYEMYARKYVGQRNSETEATITCILCGGIKIKNMEVRYCDDYKEIYIKALEKRENYYTEDFRKVG